MHKLNNNKPRTKREEILASFSVNELKNPITFESIKIALIRADREEQIKEPLTEAKSPNRYFNYIFRLGSLSRE